MNKPAVLEQIIRRLAEEVELYARAARAAHAEATDEQSRAENKYDTRGLEASYLARGQSRQAAEAGKALLQFQSLPVADLAPDRAVEVGALVQLAAGDGRSWYFMGPRAGGLEVIVEGCEVTVITPSSPLGSQLVGRKLGDRFQVENGSSRREHRIARVQ